MSSDCERTAFVTLATKGARRLLRRSDRCQPRNKDLVCFFSPKEEIEVYCLDDEAEEFEHIRPENALDADIIDDGETFRRLLDFLGDGYGLKRI